MKLLKILSAILILPLTMLGQRMHVAATNPSDAGRVNEPVVLRWDEVLKIIPTANPRDLQLIDENGSQIEFQVDDLDADGTTDELVFQDSFKPGEQRDYLLEVRENLPPRHDVKPRTDAQNWKRVKGVLQSLDDDDVAGAARERGAYRFDGVGWESESMGYRVYLDARNAVDLLGKRKPGLYWNWIGTSGTDYQADADWGMDILHIGAALGVGGIGFWEGDSVVKPVVLEHQRTRILARGPFRAVVRVEYRGWSTGPDTVDLVSTFIIYAGDRACEHRVSIAKTTGSPTLAVGIVRRDSTNLFWNAERGWMYTIGRQSRANDSLMMAVAVDPSVVAEQKEGKDDHLLLLHAGAGALLRIFITAVWQGETGRMWSEPEIREHLESIARRLVEPLQIRYSLN